MPSEDLPPSDRSPDHRTLTRFILLETDLLQSSFSFQHRSAPFGPSMPTEGLIPHRGVTGARTLGAEVPRPPLRSAHRLSQPLDGFLRTPACELISSRNHVQGSSPFKGLLPLCSHPPSSGGACPHAVTILHTHRRTGCHARHPSTSRLCSAQGCVPRVRCLASPSAAPFLGFPPLQVFSLIASAPVSPESSTHGVTRLPLLARELPRSPSAHCQRRAQHFCCQSCQPARAFRVYRFKHRRVRYVRLLRI